MNDARLDLVFLGLSLSSSWGNGHATTYRALLRGLAERGHRLLFLERDVPWYASARDLLHPDFCQLEFYHDVGDLHARFGARIAAADAVIVGSYVPDGIAVIDLVTGIAGGVRGFYDIDTPITVAALENDRCDYLATQANSAARPVSVVHRRPVAAAPVTAFRRAPAVSHSTARSTWRGTSRNRPR